MKIFFMAAILAVATLNTGCSTTKVRTTNNNTSNATNDFIGSNCTGYAVDAEGAAVTDPFGNGVAQTCSDKAAGAEGVKAFAAIKMAETLNSSPQKAAVQPVPEGNGALPPPPQ